VAHKLLILIIFVALCLTPSISGVVLLTGGLLVRIQPEEPNLQFTQSLAAVHFLGS